LFYALASAFVLTACGEDEPAIDKDDSNIREDGDDEADDESSDDDDAPAKDAGKGKDAGKAATGSTGSKDAGVAPGATKDAGKAEPAAAKGTGLPCDVAKIVSTHCAECHGDKQAFGAEFALTSIADFQKPVPGDDSKKLYQSAHERVGLMGAKRMPPASQPAIPAADLTKLTAWLKDGAKAGSGELCPVEFSEGGDAEPGAGGDNGGEFATAGSGGAQIKPIKYDDPDLKCYPFTAFAKSDRKSKYAVPTNPDFYVAFMMKAPWTGTQYIRSFKGIIDNKDVIHHWLFFKQLTGGGDGTITENALGAHPDGEMLFGWAPGGDDMYMDPDVGMAVTGNDVFLLEAHYNNKKGAAQPDASGVEVCVTPTKPEHIAGLTWVGTDLIAGTSATGECLSTHTEPVHIFSAQPHMHVKGKHMKVTVNRKGGMKEVIHDEDFDFEYQRSYILDVTLQPGDGLTTTCDYSASSTFGKGTNDEMCYFFTNSWPAGALTMPGIGTIIHGPNSCL
jgi:hypothetical protein